MGVRQVGFKDAKGYQLVTYEVLEETVVLETIIKTAKTE